MRCAGPPATYGDVAAGCNSLQEFSVLTGDDLPLNFPQGRGMKSVKMCFLKGIGYVLLMSGLLLAISDRAKADSVSYDLSANLSKGQELSGMVVGKAASGRASSYGLSLTGTAAFANDSEWPAGLHVVASPPLLPAVRNSGAGYLNTAGTDISWGSQGDRWRRHCVPEPSSMANLLLAGGFLLAGMSRARILKAAARLD
jgi:hypothetical protein